MKKYILALDQGTTSSRAILFDRGGAIVSMAQKEFKQFYPQSGWVEHDAEEIWSTQLAVMHEAVENAGAAPSEIAAIGITNQRETTVVWDKATGRPIAHAIVWQCRRTAPIIEALVDTGLSDTIKKKTGLLPDAYFSGTKIRWILENVPGARERAENGELLFGTIDTWLIWNLTGGQTHATDYTNASRTMLFNIHSLQWDDELLNALDIPRSMLPEVCPSSHLFGTTSLLGDEIPITGVAGDQQSALFGQGCFTPGTAKNTYGTGCFLLFNTGHTPVESKNGLLTTIACGPDGGPVYALEGSVFVGGAVVQWLRDELSILDSSAQSEAMAVSVPDTGGVYLVPAFTGMGAPYWDMYARGCIVGITRGTQRAHIVRAALEAIDYQICDLMMAMENDTGISLSALKVDGGAAANGFLMQFQADLLGKDVCRPPMMETTALGAAFLAGLCVGFWPDHEALTELLGTAGKVFSPSMDDVKRAKLLKNWHRAVQHSLGWAAEE